MEPSFRLKEEYAVGYEGDWLRENFAKTQMPMTVFAFSDDDMMSMKSITMLHRFFTVSKQSMVKIKPSDVDQKRIGHIG